VSDPITFPEMTALVALHLVDQIEDPVYAYRLPEARPARFVFVVRTGGPRRNIVTDQAQITVESWAETDEDAANLGQQVRGILNALPGTSIEGVPIYRVDEASGLADLPDPVSSQPRTTQTFSIAARGSVAVGS
jgi:hypothetical protein